MATPAELAKENKELKAEVAEKNAVIAEMQEAIETVAAPSAHPTVTVGKQKFNIVYKSFKLGTKLITASDIQDDKELAAELVEMKSGALVPIK